MGRDAEMKFHHPEEEASRKKRVLEGGEAEKVAGPAAGPQQGAHRAGQRPGLPRGRPSGGDLLRQWHLARPRSTRSRQM